MNISSPYASAVEGLMKVECISCGLNNMLSMDIHSVGWSLFDMRCHAYLDEAPFEELFVAHTTGPCDM